MQFSFKVVVFLIALYAVLKVLVKVSLCDRWLTGIKFSVNVAEGAV